MTSSDALIESRPGSGIETGLTGLHPLIVAKLAELGVSDSQLPGPGGWNDFLDWVSNMYRELEDLRHLRRDATVERSSYENLFHIAPLPIMQQDYRKLERWFAVRRSAGAMTIEEALGGADIASIRAVVPMITMTAANPAAQRAVGLPREEMLGPIDPRIVNEGSQTGWMMQLEAVWARKPVAHAAFTAATAQGVAYDAESILAAPLIDGVPDFARTVFTIIDVTPHRNEERRMQDLMEAKDRFLASVSHEVRTPLTAILGFARVLEQSSDLEPEDQRMMVSSVAENAQEVSDLVEDLLVAARVELGQVQVANTAHDVVDQIRQILDAGVTFTEGVELEARVESATAMCDPARLRQILRNLLTNAERYGGPNVRIEVDACDDGAVVEVVDDGSGIPELDWERIFEPYQRAHQSPGQPDSVGIGLTISRQLATLMGGSLDYRYQSGRSAFRLCLPRAT